MKNIILLVMTLGFLTFSLLPCVPHYAQAANLGQQMKSEMKDFGTKAYGDSANNPKSIPAIVGTVINVLLGLFGTILTVLLLLAGYNWMTAGGDEGKVTKAKDMIKNAVIGIAIILAAYAVSNFVINALVSATAN